MASSAFVQEKNQEENTDFQPRRPFLFRDRNFLLLWLAQVISSLGDWALLVVIPVTVYNATGSKTALGLSMISGTLPFVLFGLIGGVYADRWNRRRTMVVADVGRALAILLLVKVSSARHFDSQDLALFYGVSFLVGSFSCFFTPARQGLMTALLSPEKLLQANGLILSGLQVTMLLGPTLGGLLLAWLHPRGVFIFDALTFALSALLVRMVADQPVPQEARFKRGLAGVWHDAREGLRFVWTSPVLRPTLILLSVVLIGSNVDNTLEFAFVRDLWGATGRQFGLLISLSGLAALLTSMVASGSIRSAAPARLLLPGFLLLALAGLLFSVSKNFYAGGAILFVMGIGNTLVNLGLMTLFQTTAPNHLQGRVTATVSLVNRLSLTLGGALATLLTALFTGSAALRPIFGGVAGVFLLCSLLVWPLLGPVPTRPPLEPPLDE